MGIRRWFARASTPDHVALLVDGPNVLREEFDVDLAELLQTAIDDGSTGIGRLYLDEHASAGLIRAAEANGYDVTVTSGDVDVRLAIDAVEAILSGDFDVIAIASRDGDFRPVFDRAGRAGLRTMAIAPGTVGRSDALVQAADEAVMLDPREL